jgi:hypothetical protein
VLFRSNTPAPWVPYTRAGCNQVYSQLEAPVGGFGLDTLRASTPALASRAPGDAAYTRVESQLRRLGQARDALAGHMRDALLGAAFYGHSLNERQARQFVAQGDSLLARAAALGG